MRAPEVSAERKLILPPNVMATIGDFVNCPIVYFAMRRSCRAVYATMGATCPVSLEALVQIVKRMPRSKLDCPRLALRLVSSHSLAFINETLDRYLEYNARFYFLVPLVSESSIEELSQLPVDTCRSLLNFTLSGELSYEFTQSLATQLRSARMGLHTSDCRKVEALSIALAILPPNDSFEWERLVRAAARGGSWECFELALARSGLKLKSIDDIAFHAARSGNVAIMQRVLESRAGGCLKDGRVLWQAVFSGSLEMCQLLVRSGAKVNGTYGFSDDREAFHALIDKKAGPEDLGILELLFKSGESLNKDPHLVPFAVEKRRFDLVPALIDLGAHACIPDMIPVCRRHEAPRPTAALVQMMLKRGHKVNALIKGNPWGYAVTAAAAKKNRAAVQLLLGLGANVLVRDGWLGHTPLTAALMSGRDDEMGDPRNSGPLVKLLLSECPALAVTPMECGTFPLGILEMHVSSRWRRRTLTKRLIAAGADPGSLFSGDWLIRQMTTGLTWWGQFSAARLRRFIAGGIDLRAKFEGKTWAEALSESHSETRGALLDIILDCGGQLESNAEAFDLLYTGYRHFSDDGILRVLATMSDINFLGIDRRFGNRETLLMFAVAERSCRLIGLLLRSGAGIDVKCAHGFSPLAALLLRPDDFQACADLLLAHGADINTQGDEGWTPLKRAVISNNRPAVKWLLANKADVSSVGRDRVAVFDVAV